MVNLARHAPLRKTRFGPSIRHGTCGRRRDGRILTAPFALASALLIATLGSPLPAAAGGGIAVSWDAASVRRGAVVSIEVQSAVDLEAAEAETATERFSLVGAGSRRYLALVGVDLAWSEKVFPVDFQFYPSLDSDPYRLRVDLKIRGTEFPSQSLALPSGMVDFSDEDSVRVSADSLTIARAVAMRTPEPFWEKGFLLPVKGRISTVFGTARILNGKSRSPHGGVDVAAAEGVPVGSANDGIVVLASDLFLSGGTVMVDHGWGMVTLYAHLNSIEVEVGQEVARGQVVGRVGSTGRATGPHLHFASFLRGARVDPLDLIRATEGWRGMSP